MTAAVQQITAAASNGLTRAEVVATVLGGRAMTADEQTAFDKARGIWKLREAKRRAEKRATAAMTGAERVAKHRDGAACIDAQLAEARTKVDAARRAAAEKSLSAWIRTYCVGVLLDDPPPEPHGEKIVREMDEAVGSSRPYQILVARGGGKTSYTECCVAYAIATGRRKFCLISSINAKQAQQILRELQAIFTEEPFATDYPDVAVPLLLLDGHGKRAQRQGGHDTKVHMVADELVLPTITLPDGTPSPASGACIRAKALKSVRGTKHGTQRPDLIVLDDLQTREIAENPDRVAGVLSLIRGDVMGLAGKAKAAIVNTATTIAADDMTEQLAADGVWKTTRNPAILAWPREWERDGHGLWGDYFSMYKAENASSLKHTRRGGSLDFYRKHRKQMDAGADILNWDNYSKKDGQISGLQKLMDKWLEMGEAAFMAEYQMKPRAIEAAIPISAALIMSREMDGVPLLAVPPGFQFVAAATDINPSYALTTAVTAFKPDGTAHVAAHFIEPIKIAENGNETQFYREVFNALAGHAKLLRECGVRINVWGADAGGKQFVPVTNFWNAVRAHYPGPFAAMIGKPNFRFNPAVRSRLANEANGTILCGDEAEHARRGAGRRWINWNADAFKERAQRAWLAAVGAPGGCSLYSGGDHVEFATQIANETLRRKEARAFGDEYFWKTKEPHDFGDCMAMCYALAASGGITGDGAERRAPVRRRRIICI